MFVLRDLTENLHKGLGPKADFIEKDDFYYSAGGGIRYSTPIGPLRLDFAQLLNAPDGLADFRVHFSIGQAF